MHFILTNAATVAVAMLYCRWRMYAEVRLQRQQRLRDRVVYMLWVMASHSDCHETATP